MVERMTTDQIWWKQVPKAIQFVEEIVSFASEQRSQVLFSPGYLPWWDSLYEIVSDYINFNDPEGRVVRVTEEDISPYFDIGNFILNEFCSAEKRVNYSQYIYCTAIFEKRKRKVRRYGCDRRRR